MSNPSEQDPRQAIAEETKENPAAEPENTQEEFSTIFSDPTVEQKRRGMAPKKRAMILLICIAVIAAAGTGIALKFNADAPNEGTVSGTESTADTIYMVQREVNDLASVEITNEKESYTLVSKAGESSGSAIWQLKGFEDIELSTASSIASSAASITAQRRIADPGELSRYGLENPYSRIVVSLTDGEPYTITIGDESPDRSGRYANVSGDGAVYLISSSTAEMFVKPSTQLIGTSTFTPIASSGDSDPYFVDGTLTYFDRITLGGSFHKSPITLESDKNSTLPYLLTVPQRQTANSEKVSALLTVASSGITNSGAYIYHPGAEDLKKYGLNEPYSTLEFKFGDRTITIRLGKQIEVGYYPMMVDDKPLIYRVDANSIAWAEYSEQDLYYNLLFMENIMKVAAIELKTPEKTILFKVTQDEKNDSYTVQANDKTFNSTRFAPYYQRLIGMTAEEYLEGEPKEGELALQFTITYTDSNRKPDVIRLSKHSDRRYLFKLNGTGNALVASTRVDELIEFADWLLEGKTIPSMF